MKIAREKGADQEEENAGKWLAASKEKRKEEGRKRNGRRKKEGIAGREQTEGTIARKKNGKREVVLKTT